MLLLLKQSWGSVCLKVATFIKEKNEDNIFLQFTSYLIVIKKTTQLSVWFFFLAAYIYLFAESYLVFCLVQVLLAFSS